MQIKKHFKFQGMAEYGLLGLVLINFALVFYYVVFDYQYMMHSDSAVINLLAQEIADTGHYFPPDWNYANGDLWVLFGHTFILPFLPFFSNSFALHAVSGIVSAILVLLGTWCVTAILGQSRLARLLSLLVLSSGISVFMAENLYGQASYGTIYYMACFFLFFAWRFLLAGPGARWAWGGCFSIVVLLVFWANPQRALVSYGGPFLLALFALAMFAFKQENQQEPPQIRPQIRALAVLSLLFIAGTVLGTALHVIVTEQVASAVPPAPVAWLPFDGMVVNIMGTIRGLLSVLGGLLDRPIPLVSSMGGYQAVHLLAALTILALIPYAISSLLRAENKGRVFFVAFTLGSVLLSLFVQLGSNVANMGNPDSSVRYLIPALLCALLVLITGLVDGAPSVLARVAGLVAIGVVGTSGLVALKEPLFGWDMVFSDQPQINDRKDLAGFLVSSGLKYGYATFWNSGVLSVFSGHEARVRQIEIRSGLPMPMRFLSSNRWYRSAAWSGETFLLMNQEEAKALNWDAFAHYVGKPTRILEFRYWRVFVFPKNIAASIPAWNIFEKSALFDVNEETPHKVGHLIKEGKTAALVAEKGESGWLHFGPAIYSKPGKYSVSFDIETIGAGVSDFGRIDTTSARGTVTYAQQVVSQRGAQRIVLDVEFANPLDDLEFRVFTNGAGMMKVRSVEIRRKPAS